MQVLADSLKSDRHYILSCIKYEVLGERPVYDSFKTFCKRIGDDVMGYQEFEFWYMRFYNGELDMNYERKKDPKPMELLQLPVEIVGKCVEKLDLPIRLITRNVCKSLQIISDGYKPKFKSLQLYESIGGCPNLKFGDQRIVYRLNKDKLGTTIVYGEQEFQSKRVNIHGFAVSDLKTLVNGHNMELDSFEISDWIEDSHLVEKALNVFIEISTTLNSQFMVKAFRVGSAHPELIIPFLSLVKPGILEDLEVNHVSDEISNTEQWQQAKIGRVKAWRGVDPTEIKRLWHFEEFCVNINAISAEIMVQLKDTILTFPSLKKCRIEFVPNAPFTIDNAATALGLPIQNEEVHVPIPGSNDVFVITVPETRYKFIKIERRLL